jgi:hypothetical protein
MSKIRGASKLRNVTFLWSQRSNRLKARQYYSVLEFLNNLWGLGTEYSRNRVFVPARQATYAGGTNSLELIFALHKSFKIRALLLPCKGQTYHILSLLVFMSSDCQFGTGPQGASLQNPCMLMLLLYCSEFSQWFCFFIIPHIWTMIK